MTDSQEKKNSSHRSDIEGDDDDDVVGNGLVGRSVGVAGVDGGVGVVHV